MSTLESMPENPAQLAAIRAERAILKNSGFANTKDEEFMLAELDHAAGMLGFIDKPYFIQAGRGLSIPVGWNDSDNVAYLDFMGVSFEGRFVSYGKVAVGKIIGHRIVRALCLTFDNVTTLPSFDTVPEDHLFYTPVLAVESISTY